MELLESASARPSQWNCAREMKEIGNFATPAWAALKSTQLSGIAFSNSIDNFTSARIRNLSVCYYVRRDAAFPSVVVTGHTAEHTRQHTDGIGISRLRLWLWRGRDVPHASQPEISARKNALSRHWPIAADMHVCSKPTGAARDPAVCSQSDRQCLQSAVSTCHDV